MSSKLRERSGAGRVAAGIFSSRIMGLLRDRAIAHYFGLGAHADAFRIALRAPNILQNLLGEGTISAAFIPIYSRLIEEGREREAGRFAGAIFGLLLAAAAVFSLLGVAFARQIVTVTVWGFLSDAAEVAAGTQAVDRFALAVAAVRIVFPMTGVLVLSAWALGVLNSHRRFFLPYFAPVFWNAAIIAGVWLAAGGLLPMGTLAGREKLFFAACFGALAGGLLQFFVQLPLVFRLMKGFRVSFSTRIPGVREALGAALPVIAGRGVYQLSAYLDMFMASMLAVGAVAALGWAQTLYILPVSLFGMSVAAAELPELARQGSGTLDQAFRERLSSSLRQMSFLIVPTVLGYLVFGFLLVGALYRSRGGSFSVADNWLVYLVLGAYTLGLVATTWSRLMQNAFYAFRDTKTPARIAVLRVSVSALLALGLMFWFDGYSLEALGIDQGNEVLRLGALGLAIAASVGAWVELATLRLRLRRRVESFHLPLEAAFRMAGLALVSALPAVLLWSLLPSLHVALTALCVLLLYGGSYLGLAKLFHFSELESWLSRVR